MSSDNLKQIIEDTLLTAHNVHNGTYLDDIDTSDPKAVEGQLTFRIVEVVVNLAERLTTLSGIPAEDLWVPAGFIESIFEPDLV